ncbi:hypothetical protein VOLCADRAFT_67166, partial [Volvox carteri f. nagariensis]
GLAGLTNLGNTCFMSSSLQCLAHAVPLMRAFLGGGYLQDLNRSNPLGMKGELAEAFGGLMEQLWRGGLSAVTPRSFKAKIGRFAPQFSGYAQHDSQEFLAFLLDGLHEDTNRIKNKPYIEEKDLHGRPDEAVAAEAWSNYRARNDSLVVDHFQGLFKSTVDCPQCGFNSVKFDPFMYLSLPLPESRRRVVEVVLVHTDGSELPSRMALELASGATLGDLLRATASTAGLPAEVVTSPDSHLLAARTLRGTSATATYDELVLLTDCRVRVADAVYACVYVCVYLGKTEQKGKAELRTHKKQPRYAARQFFHLGLLDAASSVQYRSERSASPHYSATLQDDELSRMQVLYMPEAQPPYDPDQVMKVTRTNKTDKQEWVISGDCPLSEFLLFFNDPPTATTTATGTCATPEAARSGGRVLYDPELLDSPSEHPSLRDQRRRAAAGPQPVSLDACMTTFLQPERLAESDAWWAYCPRCKSHVCADKKLDLWSLPEVLVVHLKRFSYTRYSRNKLDTPVDFPLHGLDLGPYVLRPQSVPPVYDLFAVSNHYGSMGGGHYTAYAKLPSPPQDAQTQEAATHSGDRWYCFDDSRVSSVDPEGVRSPAAYVLFYRRRAEASADPRELGDLLEQLRQQRTELQQQAAAAAAAVRVGGSCGGWRAA